MNQVTMKIGDLVAYKNPVDRVLGRGELGIILEVYDTGGLIGTEYRVRWYCNHGRILTKNEHSDSIRAI